MRHVMPALFLVAAATLGFPRTAVSARPATFVRGALPGLGDVLREAALKLELVRALGADARHVTVSVSGDRAVLGGVVEERATQELAEEVALSFEGIRNVENRILERNRSGALSSVAAEVGDAALESRVKHVLLRAVGTPATRIEVEATDGVVSLRGRLPDRDALRLAVETARGVPGVRKVVDLLRA